MFRWLLRLFGVAADDQAADDQPESSPEASPAQPIRLEEEDDMVPIPRRYLPEISQYVVLPLSALGNGQRAMLRGGVAVDKDRNYWLSPRVEVRNIGGTPQPGDLWIANIGGGFEISGEDRSEPYSVVPEGFVPCTAKGLTAMRRRRTVVDLEEGESGWIVSHLAGTDENGACSVERTAELHDSPGGTVGLMVTLSGGTLLLTGPILGSYAKGYISARCGNRDSWMEWQLRNRW